MIVFKDGKYTVLVSGCVVGRFNLFDEALEAYLELTPNFLAA